MIKLSIGWTTVSTKEEGLKLARRLVEEGLVACVHIEGPITAIYHWKGKMEEAEEFKLTIKFPDENAVKLEDALKAHHPYEVPQWVVVETSHVSEEYLKWVYEVTET